MYDIAIIGGGVAGASVAYHLYSIPDFRGKVIILESGIIGKGVDTTYKLENENFVNTLGEENKYKPWQSGSNVFENPNRIKMIVTCFASTAKEFMSHHGMKGMELYNRLASFGRDQQVRIAGEMWRSTDSKVFNNLLSDELGCIQLGSLMVCDESELKEFKEEFELLKRAGFEVEWWDKEKVDELHGKQANFYAGIFFPKDAIINSSSYAQRLVECCKKLGLEIREHSSVVEVTEIKKTERENINKLNNLPMEDKLVEIILESKEKIYANKVVMATGGLYFDKTIAGILRPCYSYLSATKLNIDYKNKSNIDKMKNSPNYFTFGFTHDWALCQGYLRISGEDHFSALKSPRMTLRCNTLEQWGFDKYPHLKTVSNINESQYVNGIYSETPDLLPILGSVSNNSNVLYIMGCNAWGQAILSAAAFLVPALLGQRNLTKEEKELTNFLSIRRFRINIAKF